MSEFIRIDIYIPEKEKDRLIAFLFNAVKHGWEELEESGAFVFRIHLDREELALAFKRKLLELWPELDLRVQTVEKVDWSKAWRDFFTPVKAGSNFLILAPWMLAEYESSHCRRIIIEPRTAFGTGHHQSTFLCLRILSDLFDAGQVRAGQSFLDLGTGSGILAMACLSLGLHGLALDIDPVAVDNALENKKLNDFGEELEIQEGGLEAAESRRFDFILANILAGPLIDMAVRLSACLRPGGTLILSGILGEQAWAVADAYRNCGLEIQRIDRDEWSALICFNLDKSI